MSDTKNIGTYIDVFNTNVGIILTKLYEKFPLRINLSYNDLAIELFEDSDEDGGDFDKVDVFGATVAWLEQAEYIWASKVDNDEAFGVVLSPKGLELLKAKPDSLSGQSIGDQLLSIMKSGAKEAAKSAIKDLITLALTQGFQLLK